MITYSNTKRKQMFSAACSRQCEEEKFLMSALIKTLFRTCYKVTADCLGNSREETLFCRKYKDQMKTQEIVSLHEHIIYECLDLLR